MRAILSHIRLWARVFGGKVYNLAGIPGIVRDCEYSATTSNARIKVRAKELFTIVTVNGLDIYFHRLTGKIDGVGFRAIDYTADSTQGSEQIPERSFLSSRTFQK